jgi:leucine-rich repeat-containing G protein-coupled receptor 6
VYFFLSLRIRNLARNEFTSLPTKGLVSLRSVKTFGNSQLKDFPSPEHFPAIQKLALSYAYHCCQFIKLSEQSLKRKKPDVEESIVWLGNDVDINSWTKNNTLIGQGRRPSLSFNFSAMLDEFANRVQGKDYTLPDGLSAIAEEYFGEDYKSSVSYEEGFLSQFPIECHPQPSKFLDSHH